MKEQDWKDTLTVDNIGEVANRLERLLAGRRFTVVLSRSGAPGAGFKVPEVQTGYRLQPFEGGGLFRLETGKSPGLVGLSFRGITDDKRLHEWYESVRPGEDVPVCLSRNTTFIFSGDQVSFSYLNGRGSPNAHRVFAVET